MARSLMKALPTLFLLLICAACSSIGSRTVPKDQFNYNQAIASGSQEQILLNLVRLRYSETPRFLRVGSVISQYTRSGNVSAGVGTNSGAFGDDTATAGAGVRWSDRPVITYVPVTGKEFAKDLLTPLSPYQLFEMMQAGWPAELLIRVSMIRMNGLANHVTRPSSRRHADPEFFEMFRLWQLLGQANVIGLHSKASGSDETKMALDIDLVQAPSLATELARFQSILSLDPDAAVIEIVQGKLGEPDQLAVLTGSIWDIMLQLAWQFNAPPDHVSAGRTDEAYTSNIKGYTQPIKLRYSEERPESAFVSVFAQDYWFYIDENDRHSKNAFSFLELLLTLAQSEVRGAGPIMSISN